MCGWKLECHAWQNIQRYSPNKHVMVLMMERIPLKIATHDPDIPGKQMKIKEKT